MLDVHSPWKGNGYGRKPINDWLTLSNLPVYKYMTFHQLLKTHLLLKHILAKPAVTFLEKLNLLEKDGCGQSKFLGVISDHDKTFPAFLN